MILSFALKYWKQLALVVAVLLVFTFGYYKGYSNQKEKFDAFKLQVEVNAKIQKDKNELLIKKQTQITDNVTKEYADAVKKLNAYYADHPTIMWMPNNTTSSRVSKVSKPTSKTNGKTESNLPSPTRNATLDCASDVLQLIYLQKWINDQNLVSK